MVDIEELINEGCIRRGPETSDMASRVAGWMIVIALQSGLRAAPVSSAQLLAGRASPSIPLPTYR
jgi:hypothetical protein